MDLGAAFDLFGVTGIKLECFAAMDVIHGPTRLAAHTLKSYTAMRVLISTLPLNWDYIHVRASVYGALAIAG